MARVWVILDASNYPIDAYELEADAKAECERRNYNNNLRVISLYVRRTRDIR